MYDFLNVFIDFFFSPLYAMDLNNDIYTLVYVVVITLAVWSFVRRMLKCLNFM